MYRVVRLTVRRRDAAVAALGFVAGAGVMAALWLDGSGFPGLARAGYAVRFALPAAHPAAAGPATRAALADAPGPLPGETPGGIALGSGLTAPTAASATPRSKVPGVMALSYSLAGGANAGDAIEIDKPVSIAGADAGRVPIRIDGNARVYALGKRLAEVIAAQSGEKAVPKGLGEDFVSLEALRALGIGVRYDAIRDRLVLDPPAA